MNPQRGQIYFLPFGEGKRRPVVIVSRDSLNAGDSILIVPFTSQKLPERRQQAQCVFFEAGKYGLSEDCVAKTDEITRIPKSAIDWSRGVIGRLPNEEMLRIVRAVRYVMRDDDLMHPSQP